MIDKIYPNWIRLQGSWLREIDSHNIGQLTCFSDMDFAFSPSTNTMREIICVGIFYISLFRIGVVICGLWPLRALEIR